MKDSPQAKGSLHSSASVLLRLERFGVGYNDRVVIRDATLNFSSWRVLGLVGSPGSGKSTLLRALAGLRTYIPGMRTWGGALLNGQPISPGNAIDLVAQNARLMMLSVNDYMLNAPEGTRLAMLRKLAPAKQAAMLVRMFEAAGQAHLAAYIDQRVVDLDLADQRILAILRKTTERPALLALDEPTSGLDEEQHKRVIDAIVEARKTIPILVVTHNARDLADLDAQQAIIDEGVVRLLMPGERDRGLSYPTLAADQKQGASTAAPIHMHYVAPKGFVWVVPKVLAGMRRPGLFGDLDAELTALKGLGVRHIVGLEEKQTVDAEALARHGVEYLHVPIPDMDIPLVEEMDAIVDFIDSRRARGGAVAVHCRAGLGRTGTVLASYLVARKSASAESALEQIRKLEPLFVQTDEQIRFLAEWQGYWQRMAGAG